MEFIYFIHFNKMIIPIHYLLISQKYIFQNTLAFLNFIFKTPIMTMPFYGLYDLLKRKQ